MADRNDFQRFHIVFYGFTAKNTGHCCYYLVWPRKIVIVRGAVAPGFAKVPALSTHEVTYVILLSTAPTILYTYHCLQENAELVIIVEDVKREIE